MNSDLQSASVPAAEAGERLDAIAGRLFSDFSRSRLSGWITEGRLRVDGQALKPKTRLNGGELLSLDLPAGALEPALNVAWNTDAGAVQPAPVAFEVVAEDAHVLVVNKPAGLVVHPAPGHQRDTLMNGLLHRDPGLAAIPRGGIVHRLDRHTSGLMVVARTLKAHASLVDQLQTRTMGREYECVAWGHTPEQGVIDQPMGRHPKDRKRMAVTVGGKRAVTHYACLEAFNGCTRLVVQLKTGRTHQIRVHLAHIGHALVGDPVYTTGTPRGRQLTPALATAVNGFERQALHARELTFEHPGSGEPVTFQAPLPEDHAALLERFRAMG